LMSFLSSVNFRCFQICSNLKSGMCGWTIFIYTI
jgi:hypothetical protein